jgi:hypothetical protein
VGEPMRVRRNNDRKRERNLTFKGLILRRVIERNRDSVSEQEEKEGNHEEQIRPIQWAQQGQGRDKEAEKSDNVLP